MKIANSVKISVFVKEGEDKEKIKDKMLSFVSFDLNKEKVNLVESSFSGIEDAKTNIFELMLEKDRHIKSFFDNLVEKMGDDTKKKIMQQIDSRLDYECNFFLRFDKDKLVDEDELKLTDKGKCFHIKINVAAFPKKREIALGIIGKLFI